MATIDKETKEKILQQLKLGYGQVTLKCDDDEICLKVERLKGLKFVIGVWINGQIKGKWIADNTCHEHKYMRKTERFAYKADFRKKAKTALGVRRFKAEGFDKKVIVTMPWFDSGVSALRHLCKVCEKIEVVCIGFKF